MEAPPRLSPLPRPRPDPGAPLPVDDAARVAALRRYDVLDGPVEPLLASLARLAATICGVPTATINLLDDVRQWQAATYGFVRGEVRRSEAMCDVTVAAGQTVHVQDASLDLRFADNPFVTGRLGKVRLYAASPLRAPEGEVLGTVCVFDEQPGTLTDAQLRALDDIAEQVVHVLELRRQAAALRRTAAELERSNRDLGDVAARLGHDLRSPLTVVLGGVKVVRRRAEERLTEPERQLLDAALRSAGQLTEVVNTVLAHARPGRGAPRQCDLGVALADAVEALGPEAAPLRLDAPRLPQVPGDPVLLRLVFQNLLSNAVKFRRRDRPLLVTVGADRDCDEWVVRVADNGLGVAPEHRYRVFAMLERAHGEEYAGHGIGLATCARIVESLGGRITLTETPGGGATFVIRLPAG